MFFYEDNKTLLSHAVFLTFYLKPLIVLYNFLDPLIGEDEYLYSSVDTTNWYIKLCIYHKPIIRSRIPKLEFTLLKATFLKRARQLKGFSMLL